MEVNGRARFLALGMALAACVLGGCNSGTKGQGGPQSTLEKYFSSAARQDYATTYDCYYKLYHDKVSRDDFIKHRKEASLLKEYRIASVKQNGDTAQAVAMLTFAPSEKLHRTEPATVQVTEDMVRENGEWKIKVW